MSLSESTGLYESELTTWYEQLLAGDSSGLVLLLGLATYKSVRILILDRGEASLFFNSFLYFSQSNLMCPRSEQYWQSLFGQSPVSWDDSSWQIAQYWTVIGTLGTITG